MKKSIAIASAFAAALSAGALTGCVNPVSNAVNYTYKNASSYTAGGGEISADISDIEIDWVSGAVDIVYADVQSIMLEEVYVSTSTDVTGERALRYISDNGVLRVKYVKSGTSTNGVRKKLTVTLPMDYALGTVKVSAVSASVGARTLSVGAADISTVSGGISFGELNANRVEVESVSGNIGANITGAKDVEVESVSGNVGITVDASATDVSYRLETVSGDLKIRLAQDAPFAVDFDTVSGRFSSDYETVKSGGRYVYGENGVVFKTETVSGDVEVVRE